MRVRRVAVLAGAVLAAGCGKPKLESKVDVPTTLAAVRALADPPRVTVSVERVKRFQGQGGFRCAHPVCLVVVPLALWELAFPAMVDVANVSEGGAVTYSGMFQPDGELLQARVQRGKLVRDLRVLALRSLRKRLVVEVARAELGADGKPGPFKPTPLAGQVDLLGDYRAALARPGVLSSSATVLREAIDWLGEDARPLREERLKDPRERDETRAAALLPCDGELLKLARGLELGPRALEAALGCASPHVPGGPRKEAAPEHFLPRLGERVCSLPELSGFETKRYVELLARHVYHVAREPVRDGLVAAAAEKCPSPVRRTLLRFLARRPLAAAELAALLAAKDGSAEALLQRWNPHEPAVRAAVFAGLRSGKVPPAAVKDTLASVELAKEELTLLAELYLAPRAAHDAILWLLQRARTRPEAIAPARAALEAGLAKASDAERPLVALALVVLGEPKQAPAALRAIPASGSVAGSPAAQLALDWLERSLGCKRSELLEAARRAHAGETVTTPLCTGAR